VQSITNEGEGIVRLFSEEGKGSEFTMVLPLTFATYGWGG